MTNDLILARMQRLMCLGFEGQPAAELIEGTGRLWVERLGRYSAVRLAIAFDAIELHRKGLRRDGGGWPSIGDIIAALPSHTGGSVRVEPERRITPDSEAAARISEAARNAIEEGKRKFGTAANETAEGSALH